MGQFSWIYSNTGKQMIDGLWKDSYLLIPEKYRPEHNGSLWLCEPCYDGYGHFAGKDIYLLIAHWNREFIPELIRRHREGLWKCDFNGKTEETLMDYYTGRRPENDFDIEEMQWIGIVMSCMDKDNASLPYPIKITDRGMVYEEAAISPSDPDQGWENSEDDDFC